MIRELARLTRDILVIGIDTKRAGDPEIAAESERERLIALADKFSAEDLMRAFDVLTKAEIDIKASLQPRYHLEMALLRWIHLRHLVPITELIQTMDKSGPAASARPAPLLPAPPRPRPRRRRCVPSRPDAKVRARRRRHHLRLRRLRPSRKPPRPFSRSGRMR